MRIWFQAVVPDVWRGLRAAIATIVPFYLAIRLDRPELTWVAIGGWLGSLVDVGGGRNQRALSIGSFAVAGGVTVALASSLAAWPWAGVVLLALFGLGTSLLRALGGTASNWGTILLVAACIAVGSERGIGAANGLYFGLGASWAVLLSSIVWPVWTHLPLRRAVGEVMDGLGRYSALLAAAAATELPVGDSGWSEIARTEQRRIRQAIEGAQQVALMLRSRRSGETALGSRLRVLLGDADAQFAALIVLGEEVEHADHQRQTLRQVLEQFGRSTEQTRARLLSASFFELQAEEADEVPFSKRVTSAPEWGLSKLDELDDFPSFSERMLAKLELLIDSLSLRSPSLHHGLRVAVAVSAAATLGQWLSPTHVPWVTVTTVGVLQPYPGATIRRALERVVGTVFGSAVAAALMNSLRDPLALALCMIPLSAAAVITRPRSYRLFTFFLTPVFVLFSGPGVADWSSSVARSTAALLGGVLALGAAALIVPSWERQRLSDALVRVVRALEFYAARSFERPRPGKLAAERRAVGLALGDAETSLERMMAEPLHSKEHERYALWFVTYARRLANSLTAFNARKPAPENDTSSLENEHAIRSFIAAALAGVMADLEGRPRPPVPAPSPSVLAVTPTTAAALWRIHRYAELVTRLPQPGITLERG